MAVSVAVCEYSIYETLSRIKHTAAGFDDVSYWFLIFLLVSSM